MLFRSGFVFKKVGQHVNHQVVGYQKPFGDVLVGNFAKFRASRYVVAEELSGRYVVKSVLINKSFALCALAAAGGTEYHYVHLMSVMLVPERSAHYK